MTDSPETPLNLPSPWRRVVPDTPETLRALAARYRGANGAGMKLINLVGGKAESLIDRLPPAIKGGLEGAAGSALETAFDAAARSRDIVGDRSDWMSRALTAAMGAAGGLGGLPTALAELPMTATVLLRAIQAIAVEHGFDPETPETRADCLRVFAAAGPLTRDDGADLGFFAARVTLTGTTVHGLIRTVAPRFAAAMGQKLAAQAVPVLGAVAGAAVNYTFTGYYQEMAHVHFGLRRLAVETGQSREALTEQLVALLKR